ncbi:MAG: hypothetical protein OEX07_03150, partial [Gammaproteobacteria bacterium]|nr:hypothetical protein [Gammaproteobacteria bacterium]
GIDAVDEAGDTAYLKVVASNLDVSNSDGDVLLATQSKTYFNGRPELNPLLLGAVSVKNGDLAIVNTGALQFDKAVDVKGNINLDSSSQVTINDLFKAKNNIEVVVGAGTFVFDADGLALASTGKIESTSGNINLAVNDLIQLVGEVKALNGDINVTSDTNAVAITHIDAGSHKAIIRAGRNIEALPTKEEHIVANSVELYVGAGGTVGTFAKPIELSTTETKFDANKAFMTGNVGLVINAGLGSFLDPGVAVSSANKGQNTSAQEFSFVDATVFSQELNLFDVVNEGIRLPVDQLEDE